MEVPHVVSATLVSLGTPLDVSGAIVATGDISGASLRGGTLTSLDVNGAVSAGSLKTGTIDISSAVMTVGQSVSSLNLACGDTVQTINIGTGAGQTEINIGGAGDTVKVAGTLTYVNTTNLEVSDNTIVLNKGVTSTGQARGYIDKRWV